MPKAKREAVVLTDAKVRSLRPDPAGEYVQGDLAVPGLGIRIRPSAKPVYIVTKRRPGESKPTRVTLGRIDELTLAEARDAARVTALSIRQGIDVAAKKRADAAKRVRAREIEAAGGFVPDSFGELAERYIELECPSLARGAEMAAFVRRRLLPAWGQRSLAELRRRDLTALLDPIIAVGMLPTAHKVREVAIRIMNWAVDRGDLEQNMIASPSRGRRRAGILYRNRRDRVLTDDELRAVWRACDGLGPVFGGFVRTLMLTGQRRDEVGGMRWRELDLDSTTWTIAAERYKTKIAQVVPLSPAAVELISALPRADSEFVFSTAPGTRISGFAKLKKRLDQQSGVNAWVLHDLRRTLRTGLSALGVNADHAERVLGHVVGGLRGTYDRHTFLPEKRVALDRWAAHLTGLTEPTPANILRLAR